MIKILTVTFIAIIMVFGSLGGCSSLTSSKSKGRTIRTFNGDYETIFQSALSVLRDEMRASINSQNSESGVITAETQTQQVSDSIRAKLFSGKKRVAVRVELTSKGSNQTHVQVSAKKRLDVATIFMDKDSTRKIERDFIDRLRLRLKNENQTPTSEPPQPPIFQVDFKADVDTVPLFKPKIKDNAYAVVIGIESYRNNLPAVDFARRDAEKVREYLINAFGYREEHIQLLLDERATRSDLETYLETWLPNNLDKDGEVFIYYSGHGAPNPINKKSYLVPYNGDPGYLKKTGYEVDRLYESLSRLPAKQIVVVLDSCFSGRGDRSVSDGDRPIGLDLKEPELSQKNLVVFTASQSDQVSASYPAQQHGLLTYFLLKGIQGEADQNKDKSIDAGELFSYVEPEVKRQARRMNKVQTPQIYPNLQSLKNSSAYSLVNMAQ